MQRWKSAAAFAVLLVAGTGRLTGQAEGPEVPTLVGKWQLDPSRSDRQSRMDRGGLPGGIGGGRRPGGGGGRPGSGRPGSFPGGGGRGAGGPGGVAGEGGSPVVLQLLRPQETMEIGLSDSTVSLLDGAGFRRQVWTDGRETVDTLFGGEVRRTKVKRKADEFVLEQTIDGETKVREKYRLDGKYGDLVYDLKVEAKRMPIPVEIRRMYLRIKN